MLEKELPYHSDNLYDADFNENEESEPNSSESDTDQLDEDGFTCERNPYNLFDLEDDYDDIDVLDAKANEKLDIAIKRLINTPGSFTC